VSTSVQVIKVEDQHQHNFGRYRHLYETLSRWIYLYGCINRKLYIREFRLWL